MPLTREIAVHTYNSTYSGQTYRFDVVLDSRGLVSVRNLRTPYGLITDSTSELPDVVMSDMADARGVMQQQLAEKQVATGTLTFAADTAKDATIADGLLNNTAYRVVFTAPDDTPIRCESKTTTGFTATAAASYGTFLVPIDVTYVVLAAAQQSSTLSGTLTFGPEDGGLVTVTFPAALSTAAYRVVLSPDGFFSARVYSQTKTKMVIQLGYTLGISDSVTVGYDIFV